MVTTTQDGSAMVVTMTRNDQRKSWHRLERAKVSPRGVGLEVLLAVLSGASAAALLGAAVVAVAPGAIASAEPRDDAVLALTGVMLLPAVALFWAVRRSRQVSREVYVKVSTLAWAMAATWMFLVVVLAAPDSLATVPQLQTAGLGAITVGAIVIAARAVEEVRVARVPISTAHDDRAPAPPAQRVPSDHTVGASTVGFAVIVAAVVLARWRRHR